jgi:2,3-bisphosphoglycerate-independent phosphoglycerate mutase
LNAFVTHLADRPRPVDTFKRRWGLKGLFISSKLVEWGLSESLGMDTYKAKSSGDPARDLAERIAIAREQAAHYDYIHIHTLAPDRAAHRKDPVLKKEVIEQLDRVVGDSVAAWLDDPDILLVVASDHSTPSGGPLIHSGEPVPLTMVGEGVRVDSVRHFNEIECAGGALGVIRGGEFMFLVLNYLDRCKLNGIRNSPEDQPYWPADYEPFLLSE